MGALKGGSGSWRPKNAGTSVIGQLVAVEEGPTVTNNDGNQVTLARWIWNVFELDKTAKMDDEGKQIVTEGLSTPYITKKTKATRWLKAHLNKEFDLTEDPDVLIKDSLGRFVVLTFTSGDDGLTLGMDSVAPYAE